jgi:hypothetical protein
MRTLRARVTGGRLVTEEAVGLPEGTELSVALIDEEDELDDAERADLDAAIERGRAELYRLQQTRAEASHPPTSGTSTVSDEIKERLANKVPRGLLTWLALVQRRTSMYLPFHEQDFGRMLEGLELLISGYHMALYAHELRDEGAELYGSFPDWLMSRFGWSMSKGPIRAIRHETVSDEEAWNTFWRLLWEYCDSKLAPTTDSSRP